MLKRRRSRVAPPPPECPLGACLALIGGAWTPNIIWYLREGPRRFSELKDDIGKVSAKVLTARLRRLESDGVVVRRVMATSPPSVEYALTDLGAELEPAIEAIVDVGRQLKSRRASGLSPASR
jgi:DNA-binding HxlR family transcriptional regulator